MSLLIGLFVKITFKALPTINIPIIMWIPNSNPLLHGSLPFVRYIPAKPLFVVHYLDWIWVVKPNPMGRYRSVWPYGPFRLVVLDDNPFLLATSPTFVLIKIIHLVHFFLFVILFRYIIIVTNNRSFVTRFCSFFFLKFSLFISLERYD